MKVLLLNPPSDVQCARSLHRGSIGKLNYIWPPVDLIYIGGILEKNGFDYDFHDFQVETEILYEKLLTNRNYDVVISMYSSFIEEADMATISKIKKIFPNSILMVAATHKDRMEHNHIETLLSSYPFIDALIYDYLVNDVAKFLNGERATDLENIFFLDGGKLAGRRVSLTSEIEVAIPDHSKFRSRHYYHYDGQYGDMATVMGSFGCKMPCKFCWGPEIYPKVVNRNPTNLADEFELIAQEGFKEVYFHDYTFAYKVNAGKSFCREIIKRNIKLRWYCSARIDLVDEELISLMGQAGCRCIEFGIESGNYDVRKIYGKNFTDEDIKHKVDICKKANINVSFFMILGLVEEGVNEIECSVKFVESLPVDYIAYNILWAEPNTQLMKQVDSSIKNCNGTESLNFLNFEHPLITHEEIEKLKKKYNRSFYLRPRIIFGQLLRLTSKVRVSIIFRSVIKLFFS